MLSSIRDTVEQLEHLSEHLAPARQQLLFDAADQIESLVETYDEANLLFICTHNSRRSHLGQVTAALAAYHYRLPSVHCYSGGTEATACNHRTIAAMRRAGFQVVSLAPNNKNPHYLVQFDDSLPPQACYSKKFDDLANPQHQTIALMCCSDVDQRCPVIPSAAAKYPLHYVDPKESDDTPDESTTYDAKLLEIGAEMFFLLRATKSLF